MILIFHILIINSQFETQQQFFSIILGFGTLFVNLNFIFFYLKKYINLLFI